MGFFRRLFCKHDYEFCRKVEKYAALNGEWVYRVCRKCGKVKNPKGEFFVFYEGNGYK